MSRVFVVSPVSGVVDGIGEKASVRFYIGVEDDHVVRAPVAGRVEKIEGERGTFLGERWTVSEPKTERLEISISGVRVQLEVGKPMYVTNVIDVFARVGDVVAQSDPVAEIILGSRAEIFSPVSGVWRVLVRPGDRVEAGKTRIYEKAPFRVV